MPLGSTAPSTPRPARGAPRARLLVALAAHRQHPRHGNPVHRRGFEVDADHGHHHIGDRPATGRHLSGHNLALMIDENGHSAMLIARPARTNRRGWRDVVFGDGRLKAPLARIHAAQGDQQMVGRQSEAVEGARGRRPSRATRAGGGAYEQPLRAEAVDSRTACLHRDGVQDERQSLEILSVASSQRAAQFRRVDPHRQAT